MRLPTAALAALVLILPATALAQDTPVPATEPAAGAAQPADATTEIDRIRADFRARFVDYDLRLKALETRIEALENAQSEPAEAAAPEPSASATVSEPAESTTTETPPQP